MGHCIFRVALVRRTVLIRGFVSDLVCRLVYCFEADLVPNRPNRVLSKQELTFQSLTGLGDLLLFCVLPYVLRLLTSREGPLYFQCLIRGRSITGLMR